MGKFWSAAALTVRLIFGGEIEPEISDFSSVDMPEVTGIWLLLIVLSSSIIGITIYSARLRYSVLQASRLHPVTNLESGEFIPPKNPQLSVIIPAYNEADNIEDCITSVLNSTKLSADNLEVWVVDDRSNSPNKS